ncbi:hypothetical protein [Mycobacteroides abscessus]|uniref:hypothetical protein n=1 Tax=Mycobacteroides abscessus TaxID=36809 RepID=UPI0009AF6925|nr:hypothetical protein [Mycobacteroides abscessus]SLL18438.1 Uncharacterised protein [Mycobacteroides abscessus subsp. abscessus]
MARHKTLNEAMDAKDNLAEAEIRYQLLAEAFESMPQLRANLNPALERAKAEIVQLRAAAATKPDGAASSGKVVAFDATRFHKTTAG